MTETAGRAFAIKFTVAQPNPLDNARIRIAGLSLVLLAVNVYVCRELFRIEYLRHMGSIEAAFISIARYARDNWTDMSWFPLWYNGIPYQNSYPPLLHWLVAALAGLSGWSPALSYHFLSAMFYCAGPVTLFWLCYRLSQRAWPSFFAGLVHSLLSPAAMLIPDVRRDLGGLIGPRRLQTLVIYGEGPHVTGLTLLAVSILLLDLACDRRRPVYYVAAAFSFAATAITNWLAGAALAIAVAAYLLSGERKDMRGRVLGVLLIGALAYALAAPIVPPSTIRTIQFNARTIEGDYTQYAAGLPLRLALLAAGIAAAKYVFQKTGVSRTAQFGAYFTMVTAAVTLSWEYGRIVFVPQPHRYHVEMEWGIAILVPFALQPLMSRVPGRVRIAAVVAAILIAIPVAKSDRRFARYILDPIDMTQRVEFRLANWLSRNLPEARVMVPGSTSFWLNAFTGNPQLGGGFDQGTTNFLIRVAEYVLYSSDGAGDRDAEISLAWLRAFGVDAVATGGPKSGEYYKPFRNPRKFDGKLPVLWRDGDDTLYGIPRRSRSLAHPVLLPDLPGRAPLNGIDIEPMLPYLSALDNPSYPEASFEWKSRHSASIKTVLTPEHLVSVQITHHGGWHAAVNGHDVPVSADRLGQLLIEPRCDGPCRIELRYDGGAEMRIARALQWIAALICAAWLLAGIYFNVRKRVAPPGRPALF